MEQWLPGPDNKAEMEHWIGRVEASMEALSDMALIRKVLLSKHITRACFIRSRTIRDRSRGNIKDSDRLPHGKGYPWIN